MKTLPYPIKSIPQPYKIDTTPETFPILIDHLEKIPALPYYAPHIIYNNDILPYTTSIYYINLALSCPVLPCPVIMERYNANEL